MARKLSLEDRRLASAPSFDRVDVLGVAVSSIKLDEAVDTIERWINERCPNYVCITSVHGVMESRRNQRLRKIHNEAAMVTPDGMPLVWFLRLSSKSRTERVCGRDLMRELTAISALRGYRQFYYGGAEGVAQKLKRALAIAYPKLEVAGTLCPPFREVTAEEDEAIVNTINGSQPDILWVGLSTPKQEQWMGPHRPYRRSGDDRRRGGIRLFGRDETPSPALDAANWARMVVSPVLRATPVVAALRLHRAWFPATCLRHGNPSVDPVVRECTFAPSVSGVTAAAADIALRGPVA